MRQFANEPPPIPARTHDDGGSWVCLLLLPLSFFSYTPVSPLASSYFGRRFGVGKVDGLHSRRHGRKYRWPGVHDGEFRYCGPILAYADTNPVWVCGVTNRSMENSMGGVVRPVIWADSEARQVSPTSSSCQRSHIARSHQKKSRWRLWVLSC